MLYCMSSIFHPFASSRKVRLQLGNIIPFIFGFAIYCILFKTMFILQQEFSIDLLFFLPSGHSTLLMQSNLDTCSIKFFYPLCFSCNMRLFGKGEEKFNLVGRSTAILFFSRDFVMSVMSQ